MFTALKDFFLSFAEVAQANRKLAGTILEVDNGIRTNLGLPKQKTIEDKSKEK